MKRITSVGPHRAAASTLVGAVVLAISFGSIGQASASDMELDACGGVLLQASASCEVFPTETCTTECEPVAFEEVCAFRLTSSCEGSCTAEAAVDCQSGCETSCVPTCTTESVDQPPNCMGLCMSDCQQDCTATCADSTEPHCRSSCAHTCSRDCHAQCEGETETECAPVCTTACSGSCEARASIGCQVSCQSEAFATCETEVVEECETNCETTGGGIFCDGQFLATEDLQACADQLEAEMDISVDLSATFHAEAEADGKGTFGCSIDPQRGHRSSTLLGSIGGLLLVACVARILRRRG